jgi:RecB family exonuclease
VASADPERWWGLREPTASEVPVVGADEPVPLSGSSLTTMVDCPLRWFLERRAGGESASTASIGFGTVLHTLADAVAAGRLPADSAELNAWLDRVWHQLEFESAWISERERGEAEQALRRFVAWHLGRPERSLVGTEVAFEVGLPDPESPAVVIRGRMDRVEVDAEGNVRVADLKTGRAMPTGPAVARHVQLAVYQKAVDSGQIPALPPGARSAGAELVQLRADDSGYPKVQPQSPLEPGDDGRTWLDEAIDEAEGLVRKEDFVARRNDGCDRCPVRTMCPVQPEGQEVV